MVVNQLKILVACAIAATAVSVVGASSASALSWKINGTILVGSESITPKMLGTGDATFESHLPGATGAAITTICKAITAPGAKITAPTIFSVTEIDLWLCTVGTPAGCKIVGGKIKTTAGTGAGEALTARQYISLKPSSGKLLATIGVEGCSAEGNFKIENATEGTFGSRCIFLTNVEEVLKGCMYDATTGGTLVLNPGSKSVTLTGLVGYALSGANAGKIWGLS